MKIEGKVVIVTGAGSGIGRALCQRFSRDNPAGLVASDINADSVAETARLTGCMAVQADMADESDVQQLAQRAIERFGRVDLVCSNAGFIVQGGEDLAASVWQKHWDVNVMAHVYATRAFLPGMLERGDGYFVYTASGAGLLTYMESAPYTVSKHATVAFAEWIAIAHGAQGVKVSCLCPQGVRTPMLAAESVEERHFLDANSVSAEEAADCVVAGLAAEKFLILTHPEIAGFVQKKVADYDRWLGGMRRFRADAIARLKALRDRRTGAQG